MKQISGPNTVDLIVSGQELDVAVRALAVRFATARFERAGHATIRVTFRSPNSDYSSELGAVLSELPHHRLQLRSVRQVGELEDALIQRLGEDRMRGFARALDDRGSLVHGVTPGEDSGA